MADAITAFIVKKTGNYLMEEVSMLMGVEEKLKELETEFKFIQAYVKDAESREREDGPSKEWTKLVLDIGYDIEDLLDRYKRKAKKRLQRQGWRRMANIGGKKMDGWGILNEIRKLKRRILDAKDKRVTYGIDNVNEPRARENASSFRVRELRRARSVNQEELVGLEDDGKILLAKILGTDRNCNSYIISIFGMGGLGKTAITRKLYNSIDVKRRFEYRAWTYVSQEYNTREMLTRIIISLGAASAGEIEKIRMFTEQELEIYLYNLLEGKRYLLVVDDIWQREAWESLKRALPRNDLGSRVIITTRIQAVAEGIDQRVYAHKLRFLTFEESWNLFQQKAFRDIDQGDQELQRMGKEMVKKCDGLPLAVAVLGGLLSRKRPNQWNDVYASLWRRLKDDSIHISTVFDLSFKELQHELKLCFLYLSVFPEDYEIDVEKLIWLLVAEGFIPDDEEMMMEDLARYYIEELIDTTLLEAVERERGRVKSCRIHDLLRDVAVKKAKELNFVNVYNEQHRSTTCRREVVHHLMYGSILCDRHANKGKGIRSFMVFGEGGYVDCITLKLKLLRVLNLNEICFVREGKIVTSSLAEISLPDEIGELLHLKYLGIAETHISILPAFISNLQSLETLDAWRSQFDGTTDLRELTSLRHVIGRFLGEFLIGEANNLQTLRSITSYSWSKLNYELLQNLRDLEISDFGSTNIGNMIKTASVDLASIFNVTTLRVLSLEVRSLKMSSFLDSIITASSLESLTIVGADIEEDIIPALQKLPLLEDLILRNCHLPTKMSISAQGFGRLIKLHLSNVSDELQIEEEALPRLMELIVTSYMGSLPKLLIPARLQAMVRKESYD